MPVRRQANPEAVQHAWDAIHCTFLQKTTDDIPNVLKYLQKVFSCSIQLAENYIQQVIQDNLLIVARDAKGNECFKIPTAENETQVDDGYDWYCIECHLAGDVTCCQTCYRVFHQACLKSNSTRTNINEHSPISLKNRTSVSNAVKLFSSVNDTSKTDTISENDAETFCTVCRMLRSEKPVLIEKNELNYLLNFILNRIKIWLPSNITNVLAPRAAYPWMTETEVNSRVRHLLYKQMDIPLMEKKIQSKSYTTLAEFHADVITIQHNVAIFHGLNSQEFTGAEYMIVDSKYDLVELQQCVDCYRHSNEKRNKFWFCIPCQPPHKLVWAKQKGYPYWPAKVIKVSSAGYDVRFFGAKHLRAVIQKDTSLKPIEINIQKIQLKKTIALNKALEELTEHQRLLKNPDEVAEIMSQTPPISKPKSLNKNKKAKVQTTSAASSSSTTTVTNDVYEFSDTLQITEPPEQVEKKKRGRKPKPKSNIILFNEQSQILTPRVVIQKLEDLPNSQPVDLTHDSPDSLKTIDSIHDVVTSSTENVTSSQSRPNLLVEAIESDSNVSLRSRSESASGSNGTEQLERVFSDPVENLRRQLEQISDRDVLIKTALQSMQLEMDRKQKAYLEQLRSMADVQKTQISETKKKQWCYYCEQEAIYHCCWNTAYCSLTCQQQHWQTEHKKTCRRKR